MKRELKHLMVFVDLMFVNFSYWKEVNESVSRDAAEQTSSDVETLSCWKGTKIKVLKVFPAGHNINVACSECTPGLFPSQISTFRSEETTQIEALSFNGSYI